MAHSRRPTLPGLDRNPPWLPQGQGTVGAAEGAGTVSGQEAAGLDQVGIQEMGKCNSWGRAPRPANWPRPAPQGGRRHQALRHLPHGHGLRLRGALQPVRLAAGAGAALPAHVAAAAQRRARRHACPPGARARARALSRRPPSAPSSRLPVSPSLGLFRPHLSVLLPVSLSFLLSLLSLCVGVPASPTSDCPPPRTLPCPRLWPLRAGAPGVPEAPPGCTCHVYRSPWAARPQPGHPDF